MKRTRDRKGRGIVGAALAALLIAVPASPVAADPRPSLKELSEQVEEMHLEIETLTEQYNGQREKLKAAKKAVANAKKRLATAEADLTAKKAKATMLVEAEYMTGGFSRVLEFTAGGNPETYLDRAATTYALRQQQSLEVLKLTKATQAAERARKGAQKRIDEVDAIVKDLGAKRDRITKLVAKVESRLFRRALGEAGRPGTRAVKVNLPLAGDGKAVQAARWALTQQLKPYVWGAAGPSGYDCSGLVMAAYRRVGISLPHYTGDQWTAGRHISRDELRPGDLVFFYSDLHHVGIYLGGGMMVHAPRTGDVVRIASIDRRPYAGAVRIAD